MLRYGKPVAEEIEKSIIEDLSNVSKEGLYVAIIMLGSDHPGKAYVSAKQKFAERVGLQVKVMGNDDTIWTEVDILQMIEDCNEDNACVGIMVQLPLPEYLQSSKQKIVDAISRTKDIDLLGSALQNMGVMLPATPRAVVAILDYYKYDLQGKNVAMLGYSDLIGKPLSYTLGARGASVKVFTIESDQEEMKKYCHDSADLIISATGQIHLIDASFVRDDNSQVVIDVGRGYKDGKAVGDVDRQTIENKVAAITPVPGGVGPVTVASLFANILTLQAIIVSVP